MNNYMLEVASVLGVDENEEFFIDTEVFGETKSLFRFTKGNLEIFFGSDHGWMWVPQNDVRLLDLIKEKSHIIYKKD